MSVWRVLEILGLGITLVLLASIIRISDAAQRQMMFLIAISVANFSLLAVIVEKLSNRK